MKRALVGIAIVAVFGLAMLPLAGCSSGSDSSSINKDAPADDGKQPERLAFIQKLQGSGIITEITTRTKFPRVHVGKPFYALAFKEKEAFMNAVLSYYWIEDPESHTLIIKDAYDNKQIGTFNKYGLSLK